MAQNSRNMQDCVSLRHCLAGCWKILSVVYLTFLSYTNESVASSSDLFAAAVQTRWDEPGGANGQLRNDNHNSLFHQLFGNLLSCKASPGIPQYGNRCSTGLLLPTNVLPVCFGVVLAYLAYFMISLMQPVDLLEDDPSSQVLSIPSSQVLSIPSSQVLSIDRDRMIPHMLNSLYCEGKSAGNCLGLPTSDLRAAGQWREKDKNEETEKLLPGAAVVVLQPPPPVASAPPSGATELPSSASTADFQ